MGFSARAYWRVGGFRALAVNADTDLVERFESAGYATHGCAPCVGQLERSAAGDCA
jgi:hypothetical protein